MKKGVVMIMALSLIMVLTLAILKSTTTTENYLNRMSDTVFNAQFNRTFLDMTGIIKDATSQIKDADAFSFLVQMPLVISDDKTSLQGVMTLSSAGGKFNINNLIDGDKNQTINQSLYDLFSSILSSYNVSDSVLLMSMLLDVIDKDQEQRAFGSELAYMENTKLSDGGIPNKVALRLILDAYVKQAHDDNVYKIPWQDFVTFSGKKIDYNYINSKIKAILEQDYGISVPYDNSLIKKDEDLSLDNEQKQIFKNLNIIYYVPRVACNFKFFYMDKEAEVDFVYDLEVKRISNIETIF